MRRCQRDRSRFLPVKEETSLEKGGLWVIMIERREKFGLVDKITCIFFPAFVRFFSNMLLDIFLLDKCFTLSILQQTDLHQDHDVMSCIWRTKLYWPLLRVWGIVNSCSLCSFSCFYSVFLYLGTFLFWEFSWSFSRVIFLNFSRGSELLLTTLAVIYAVLLIVWVKWDLYNLMICIPYSTILMRRPHRLNEHRQ